MLSVQDKIPNLETQKRIATALESLAKTLSPSSLQTYIDERINAKRLETYPVGYVWVSFSETNPSEIVGGTWELVEQGRMLLSAGSDYSVGSIGGSAEHSHKYAVFSHVWYGATVGSDNNTVWTWDFESGAEKLADVVRNETTTVNSGLNAGSKQTTANIVRSESSTSSASNLSPYIAVYMFRRTA